MVDVLGANKYVQQGRDVAVSKWDIKMLQSHQIVILVESCIIFWELYFPCQESCHYADWFKCCVFTTSLLASFYKKKPWDFHHYEYCRFEMKHMLKESSSFYSIARQYLSLFSTSSRPRDQSGTIVTLSSFVERRQHTLIFVISICESCHGLRAVDRMNLAPITGKQHWKFNLASGYLGEVIWQPEWGCYK